MLPVVALAAAVWVGLLAAAPVLPGTAGAVLYGLGSLICHQIPERSFHLAGFQLPVCARCFGLYAGAGAGAVGYVCLDGIRRWSPRALAAGAKARMAAGIAAAPTLLTLGAEMSGIWAPSNATRAVAGVPAGVLAALVVMNALATLHYGGCALPRPTGRKPRPRSTRSAPLPGSSLEPDTSGSAGGRRV